MITYDQLVAVADHFRSYPHDWFISGGWAMDLFVGDVTREHEDLEIGVYRDDQRTLRSSLLPEWALSKVADTPFGPAMVPWYEGEYLELPIHQVRAFQESASPTEFEMFLNDADGELWWFRRVREITRPRGSMYLRTASGIPYLQPEIQLLYKARLMRSRDKHDFGNVLPRMGGEQRAWLRDNLQVFLPGHEWLAQLQPFTDT